MNTQTTIERISDIYDKITAIAEMINKQSQQAVALANAVEQLTDVVQSQAKRLDLYHARITSLERAVEILKLDKKNESNGSPS